MDSTSQLQLLTMDDMSLFDLKLMVPEFTTVELFSKVLVLLNLIEASAPSLTAGTQSFAQSLGSSLSTDDGGAMQGFP